MRLAPQDFSAALHSARNDKVKNDNKRAVAFATALYALCLIFIFYALCPMHYVIQFTSKILPNNY
jgi:hypothetical protein